MENKPRASIHCGGGAKSFTAAEGSEAERRGWDEHTYQFKNTSDKNNHYDWSRHKLNFEVIKGGRIIPLGSNPVPLHDRLNKRLEELHFKPYTDNTHQTTTGDNKAVALESRNSPNCTVGIIFGGDHDVMMRLAFGEQNVDTVKMQNNGVRVRHGIYDWARDTYKFCCDRWGEDNVISFAVHLDETGPHAHVQTIPVAINKKHGRIGSVYTKKNDPSIVLKTKEWKKLPPEEQALYVKSEAKKEESEGVSYAKVWGENKYQVNATYSKLHTDYHDQVGYKYGLERGYRLDELTDEEARARVHKSKAMLEAERQAKQALSESEAKKLSLDEEINRNMEEAAVTSKVNEEIQAKNANLTAELEILADDIAKQKKEKKATEAGFKAKALNFLGAGELAEARKEIESKDKQIESLKQQLQEKDKKYNADHAVWEKEHDELIEERRNNLQYSTSFENINRKYCEERYERRQLTDFMDQLADQITDKNDMSAIVATFIALSGGSYVLPPCVGGGTASSTGWRDRDDDEEEKAFLRRCLIHACKVATSRKGRSWDSGRHR